MHNLVAVFNILACVGWSSVNSIAGAELIHAVNTDVPGWAGVLIIAICTLFVVLFGYKVVHVYEFYSWIPSFIVFLIVLGEYAHSGEFVNVPMGVGEAEIGSVLSFGAVVFGFAIGWVSYASDYTAYQEPTNSRTKIFVSTWLGLTFPLLFVEMLGVAIIQSTENPESAFSKGYEESGPGGLLAAVLITPLGTFGKFCSVLLALSIIANNCPNLYSVALTAQVLGRWAQMVPRFIWTIVATGAYIAIAIAGYFDFEEVLENFVSYTRFPKLRYSC